MLNSAIQVNVFLLQYCRALLTGIGDERMTEQPFPGANHPAWILGHLAWAADGSLEKLGGTKVLPAGWTALFGTGTQPSAARESYPSSDELVRAVEQSYERLRKAAATAGPERLSQPTTNPRMKDNLPTLKDAIAFLLTGHMGVHLGQLSTWRRMIGLPPLF
jgi:hypothetical protein